MNCIQELTEKCASPQNIAQYLIRFSWFFFTSIVTTATPIATPCSPVGDSIVVVLAVLLFITVVILLLLIIAVVVLMKRHHSHKEQR